jgi:hypothetical protein
VSGSGVGRLAGGVATARVPTAWTAGEVDRRAARDLQAVVYLMRACGGDLLDVLGLSGPCRIQRRGSAGWRMPDGAAYVGCGTRWGNPYRPGDPGVPDAGTAVGLYRRWLLGNPVLVSAARRELAGRDLVCWCALPAPGCPDLCHGVVLLVQANRELHRAGDGSP